jgi:hypothetical protein
VRPLLRLGLASLAVKGASGTMKKPTATEAARSSPPISDDIDVELLLAAAEAHPDWEILPNGESLAGVGSIPFAFIIAVVSLLVRQHAAALQSFILFQSPKKRPRRGIAR